MQLTAASASLPESDVLLLTSILNGAWGTFFAATPELLRGRLASGHLMVVGQDAATPEELSYIGETYGLTPKDGRIPIALLETIDAVTGGDPARVPSPYARLTGNGAWRAPLADADTLVFVDLTTATSRQRSGIGRDLVRFALSRRGPAHRHVYTFTPNVEPIVAWHVKRGARRTGMVLAGARPGHSQPDVQLMDYSGVTAEQVT